MQMKNNGIYLSLIRMPLFETVNIRIRIEVFESRQDTWNFFHLKHQGSFNVTMKLPLNHSLNLQSIEGKEIVKLLKLFEKDGIARINSKMYLKQ